MFTFRPSVVACFILFFAIFLSTASRLQAQEVDLSIMPSTVEVLIKPDTVAKIPFKISNQADSVSLIPSVMAFKISLDGNTIEYKSIKDQPIAYKVFIDGVEADKGFVLSKGKTKNVELDLRTSDSSEINDYYLSFIIETQPEDLDKKYSAKVKTRISVPILITVSETGSVEVKGAIGEFHTVGGYEIPFFGTKLKVYDSFSQIPIALSVSNLGRNFFKTDGSIVVRGSFGEKALYQIERQNVLSGRTRVQKPQILKGFFIGRYALSTSVNLGGGSVQLSDSIVFYAFPFKMLAVGLLASAIGVVFLKRKR